MDSKCIPINWSISFSLGVSPLLIPRAAIGSLSAIAFLVACICSTIPSLKLRKCLDIAFDASARYTVAAPSPAADSNDEATAVICSQYFLYFPSTFCHEAIIDRFISSTDQLHQLGMTQVWPINSSSSTRVMFI
ncbi:hypothetical protein IEQ34_014121 [Dendrobium chrysotoxum]|uniref:Uncharacterized protein n=1 Tax=Dendrobium chrysotoxum TaxID=161865 RepID=A0AAV7GKL5_DENCH|nr:hypothetical protein IEQ34_014121 [Dendrobium chrysotoxum]